MSHPPKHTAFSPVALQSRISSQLGPPLVSRTFSNVIRLKLTYHAAKADGVERSFAAALRLKLKHHAAEAGGVYIFSQLRSDRVQSRDGSIND